MSTSTPRGVHPVTRIKSRELSSESESKTHLIAVRLLTLTCVHTLGFYGLTLMPQVSPIGGLVVLMIATARLACWNFVLEGYFFRGKRSLSSVVEFSLGLICTILFPASIVRWVERMRKCWVPKRVFRETQFQSSPPQGGSEETWRDFLSTKLLWITKETSPPEERLVSDLLRQPHLLWLDRFTVTINLFVVTVVCTFLELDDVCLYFATPILMVWYLSILVSTVSHLRITFSKPPRSRRLPR